MIIDNLYPTNTTQNVGRTSGQFQDEFTKNSNTAYSDAQSDWKSNSYWLGYISIDNLPMSMQHGHFEYDDTNIYFKNDTIKENCPCGYMRMVSDDSHLSAKNTVIAVDNVPLSSAYHQGQFINSLHPEFSGAMHRNNSAVDFIGLRCFVYDAGENLIANTTATIRFTGNNSRPFYDWLIGDGVATVAYGNGNYGTVDYTAADFADGMSYRETTTGHFVRAFLVNYDFAIGGYYNGGQSGANYHTPFFTAQITYKTGDTAHTMITGSNKGCYNESWGFGRLFSPTSFSYIYNWLWGSYGGAFNGANGTFNRNFLPNSTRPYVYDGNVLLAFNSYNETFAYPIYPVEDVLKHYSLMYRVDLSANGSTPSYVNGVTYATDVSETNEFLAKLKTGNIGNQTFKDSLRPWQYGDFKDDDFDPDDIPPYVPPTPSGDDTPGDEPQDLPHDDGDPPDLQKDRTVGVPAMFLTQYALTSAELQTVGSNLWTTWLTPNTDIWKNFFLPYAQDFGTLNISAALDFIVSLKVFPFEFTIDYYTLANGVRMGTGHTDFLGGSAPVVNSQIICIDAGSVKVELPNPYNDFRDMYNCSTLCFMPYCGTVELNLQEVLGRTLKASYFIDLQSGGCTCVIECEGDAGDYVIASKTGQIGFTLPMTATNAGQLAAQAMGDATKVIGTLSGFFFDSGKTIGNNITSAISAQLGKKTGVSENGDVSLLSGNTFETSTKLGQSAVNAGLSLANQALDMLSRSAVDMPMLSGGGSAESFMFPECVSIQIRRGKYKKPDNYPHSVGHYNLSSHPISYFKGKFTGTPATGSNTNKGFCTFVGIDTSGLDCRDDERAEIISLLESGVYL